VTQAIVPAPIPRKGDVQIGQRLTVPTCRDLQSASSIACVTILRQRDAPVRLDGANMKCILVAIDFSDVTPSVIDLARQLARALGAEIHLLHVKELTAAATPGTLGYGLAGMPELAPMSGVPGFEPMPGTIPEDEGQPSKLAKWQKEIAQDGIKVSLHEPTGAVAEGILNQADELNADMIVMGAHGHGAMYNLLVGSATKGVLKRSTRPVLLVPAPKSS
jgi:nucleotide-binding universal stress UspA family protein